MSHPDTESAYVILIDDDAMCLSALAMTFENIGFRAHSLQAVRDPDGLRALARRPCLALVDFHLRGGLGGSDCVRLLRQRFPGLPCVLLTGDTSAAAAAEAAALGCLLLRKPVRSEALVAAALQVAAECPLRHEPGKTCLCVGRPDGARADGDRMGGDRMGGPA